MIKPESQNTGIETINPVMLIVMWDLFFPNNFKKYSAIVFAPPLFSMKTPMIVPKAITIPIFFSVCPNPSVKLLIIVKESKPSKNPLLKMRQEVLRKDGSLNALFQL